MGGSLSGRENVRSEERRGDRGQLEKTGPGDGLEAVRWGVESGEEMGDGWEFHAERGSMGDWTVGKNRTRRWEAVRGRVESERMEEKGEVPMVHCFRDLFSQGEGENIPLFAELRTVPLK